MIIDFIKKRKLFSILLFVFLISFILGCFFIFFISDDNKVIVKDGIELYFNGLNNLNYTENFIVGLINNIGITLIIWLLGISIFGCFIIFIIYFIKTFVVSFSFSSIIYVFGFKGIILSIIYSFSYFINLGILFILSYYGVSFSILLFKYFFKNKDYNRIIIVKRYFKVLLFCCLGIVLNLIFDSYLIPRILLLF
jgi:hypothetical protein